MQEATGRMIPLLEKHRKNILGSEGLAELKDLGSYLTVGMSFLGHKYQGMFSKELREKYGKGVLDFLRTIDSPTNRLATGMIATMRSGEYRPGQHIPGFPGMTPDLDWIQAILSGRNPAGPKTGGGKIRTGGTGQSSLMGDMFAPLGKSLMPDNFEKGLMSGRDPFQAMGTEMHNGLLSALNNVQNPIPVRVTNDPSTPGSGAGCKSKAPADPLTQQGRNVYSW